MAEKGEEVPIDQIPEAPQATDTAQQWLTWIKALDRCWSQDCTAVQTPMAAQLKTRIQENIGNLLERWLESPRSVLDSVLERHRGKVVLDRIQITDSEHTHNLLEPQEIVKYAGKWFEKWHGPRPAQPMEPRSCWEKRYQPLGTVDQDGTKRSWNPPSFEEFLETVKEALKGKAPGVSGLSNERF